MRYEVAVLDQRISIELVRAAMRRLNISALIGAQGRSVGTEKPDSIRNLSAALRTSFIGALLLLFCAPWGKAQADANGPMALIFTYRAQPGQRVKFRSIMAEQGIAQLDRWQKEGVFSSYKALFTAYAGENVPDMFLIVRFAHFTDLNRWQQIEKTNPGGLPTSAQAVASVATSAAADILKENRSAASTKDSQFFVLEYGVLADMPKYASYVRGYVAPQFESWMKSGALISYVSFVDQNPAGAPWSSMIILEYKDLHGLAQREIIKNKARADLAVSDAVWKRWSEDKSAIRTEKAAIPALALK